MTTGINSNEQNYKKPSALAVAGGVVAGSITNNLVSQSRALYTPKIFKEMGKLSESLTADEFKQVEDTVSQAVKDTGLDKKGVGIIKATAENAEEITQIMSKEIDANPITKIMPKFIKDIAATINTAQMASGKNACYTFASKKIIMPEKDLILAAFHEAGHAMNANLSTIGKALQKCRPLTMLMVPISLIALFKTKKADGEEPKNKLDKATDFVKKHAGKLTFLTFAPILIEEGMATLKGNGLAKKLLSPDLAKKVSKTNALGYLTYLGMAVLSSVGIFLGTKVKDKIAHNKTEEKA